MARRMLWALGILGCTVAVVLWLLSPDAALAPEAVQAPSGRDGPVHVEGLPAMAAVAPPVERREVLPVDEPSPQVAEQAPVASSGPALTLSGRVVLETVDGGERHDLEGSLELVLWQADRGWRVDVPVTDGGFTLELHATESGFRTSGDEPQVFDGDHAWVGVSADGARLEGPLQVVIVADPAARFTFGESDVVVRLREVPAVQLHVVDAVSGVDVPEATVIASPDWTLDDMLHPGPRAAAVEPLARGPSPLTIRPDADQASGESLACFVHSPGYAWAPLSLDASAGGERRLQLNPGGTVDVLFSRPVQASGAVLRLRPAEATGSRPALEAEVSGKDALAIDGLLPGSYALSVEVGRWWKDPLVLAGTSIEVMAGVRVEVQIALDEVPELVTARLAGRLIVPEAWGRLKYLSIALLDTPLDGGDGRHVQYSRDMQRIGAGVYAWDAGEVQTGRYELNDSAVELGVVVELGPEGREDLVVEVPPPVDVSVVVRDALTGELASLETIHWNCRRPEGVTGGGLEAARADPETGVFHLRVPDGVEVRMSAMNFQYDSFNETFVARQGLQVNVDVEPAAVVIVRLRDGETPVPWPGDDYGDAEPLDGEGRLATRGHQDGGLRFNVTEPGRYRVQIPALAGYEEHEPIVVHAVRGETREVTVRLTRQP